jgi:hypothetical protein
MKILRVFPRKTSLTPIDDMVIINEPPGMFVPECDEVHISCVFTWDKPQAEWLKYQWEAGTDKPVKLGGPAYGSPCDGFVPGLYVKHGITITSRGCNNNCKWCLVPEREGRLRELPVTAGNVINDNNFLQCSRPHKDKVFQMLRGQRRIAFKGGLQCCLIDEHFIDNVSALSVAELWLACDNDAALPSLQAAADKLKRAGFTRTHIHAYVLIGDDMEANEARLREVYHAGAMPFAQLFRPADNDIKYSPDWRRFARQWQRPAATKAHMERGTDWRHPR